MPFHLVNHPLAQHLVTHLRDSDTPPALFRTITKNLTTILALEATQDLGVRTKSIQTPLEPMESSVLAQGLVVVPILRAGLGMLTPFVELFPDVAVGYVGLARDHETAIAAPYYLKLPDAARMAHSLTLLVDPMLATGGSACQAIDAVKAGGAVQIRLVCIVAAPEGVAEVTARHPGIPILAAALDRELDARKYILPGLGDFGDRLYGTQ